ncbi:MAG TPA: aminodeoxychorismate lyase [Steroidobacteraceae bacterium]|nr:aminodeoxychorismate lyase [Steroidobacteraceae bacterium]
MVVLVDGREDGAIDPADRGLNYGDGLFETLAVKDGRARFFGWHFERLAQGAGRLGIPLPDAGLLREEVARAWPLGRGVVRIVITRGAGERGYRPPRNPRPLRIVAGAAWPQQDPASRSQGVRLRWCSTRLGRNPLLAGIKHLNRLEQVLARAEWDDPEVAEGLLMDHGGKVISATQANLFVVTAGRLVTPALDACGVAGVMRRAFRAWAQERGETVVERAVSECEVRGAEGLFLTNALIGAWPVRELDGRRLSADGRVAAFNAWLERQ